MGTSQCCGFFAAGNATRGDPQFFARRGRLPQGVVFGRRALGVESAKIVVSAQRIRSFPRPSKRNSASLNAVRVSRRYGQRTWLLRPFAVYDLSETAFAGREYPRLRMENRGFSSRNRHFRATWRDRPRRPVAGRPKTNWSVPQARSSGRTGFAPLSTRTAKAAQFSSHAAQRDRLVVSGASPTRAMTSAMPCPRAP